MVRRCHRFLSNPVSTAQKKACKLIDWLQVAYGRVILCLFSGTTSHEHSHMHDRKAFMKREQSSKLTLSPFIKVVRLGVSVGGGGDDAAAGGGTDLRSTGGGTALRGAASLGGAAMPGFAGRGGGASTGASLGATRGAGFGGGCLGAVGGGGMVLKGGRTTPAVL